MVYLTGDTHGDLDRFRHGRLRWLGKRDIVVVLGDFGFVWDGSAEEQKKLDWLRKRPYTLLFLDGSHENYDLLAQYPETEQFGGRVQSLGGNVYHVCRGSVLELDMSNRLDTIRFCPLREPEVFQSVTTDGRRLYFGRALEITAEEAMSLAMVPPPRYVPGGEKGG